MLQAIPDDRGATGVPFKCRLKNRLKGVPFRIAFQKPNSDRNRKILSSLYRVALKLTDNFLIHPVSSVNRPAVLEIDGPVPKIRGVAAGVF